MIFALNEKFEKIGIVEQFESLIWHNVWNGCGDFELHIPKDLGCAYIYDGDLNLIGMIEQLEITEYKTILKGRLLKGILDRFICPKSINLYQPNNVETNIKNIVADTLSAVEGNLIEIEPTENRGYTTEAIYPLGENLLEVTEKLLLNSNLSAELNYDFNKKKLVYSITQAIDKSNEAPIGLGFGNILSYKYDKDISDYRTRCIGYGAELNDVKEYFEISSSNTFDDRTIFLDLSGLSRTKEDNVAIPPSEYTSLLLQEAKSKLGEYRVTENIEIESKEFYNLGEIRTFKGGGIVAKQMVTDVIFAYEDGRIKKTCSFGYQRLNRTAKLERRFKK